jgi:hypothetical protein
MINQDDESICQKISEDEQQFAYEFSINEQKSNLHNSIQNMVENYLIERGKIFKDFHVSVNRQSLNIIFNEVNNVAEEAISQYFGIRSS